MLLSAEEFDLAKLLAEIEVQKQQEGLASERYFRAIDARHQAKELYIRKKWDLELGTLVVRGDRMYVVTWINMDAPKPAKGEEEDETAKPEAKGKIVKSDGELGSKDSQLKSEWIVLTNNKQRVADILLDIKEKSIADPKAMEKMQKELLSLVKVAPSVEQISYPEFNATTNIIQFVRRKDGENGDFQKDGFFCSCSEFIAFNHVVYDNYHSTMRISCKCGVPYELKSGTVKRLGPLSAIVSQHQQPEA